MIRIVLIGLLSFCGASSFAMKNSSMNDLQAALGAKNESQIKQIVDALKANCTDIDRAIMASGKVYSVFLHECLSRDPSLKKIIEGIFAELQPHRSNPPEAVELRRLVKFGADSPNSHELEAFLADKCLNVDRILYDPKVSSIETIGAQLTKHSQQDRVKAVLRLKRVLRFRGLRYSDPYAFLMELLEGVIIDPSLFDDFKEHYSRLPITQGMTFDVDIWKPSNEVAHTFGSYLTHVIEKCPANEGALLISEYVQPNRSGKMDTLRALFFAYAADPKNLDYLIAWFKKFPVDVDRRYDIAAKLDELLVSPNAAVRDSALLFAELVRPYRKSEKMKIFSELLKSYQADKSKLPEIKDWFDKSPFDIDSTLVDSKQLSGKSFGEVVNALEDDALSEIFRGKRSKAPPVVVKKPLIAPDHVDETPMNELRAALDAKNGADIKRAVDSLKMNCVDIDSTIFAAGKTYSVFFNECLRRNPSLKEVIEGIFAELQPHRSNPPEADELRRRVKVATDSPNPAELEVFLADKRLNIDLIPYDPKVSGVSIGSELAKHRKQDRRVKEVLGLKRILEFRELRYSFLLELLKEAIEDPSLFDDFKEHYSKLCEEGACLDVDNYGPRSGVARLGSYLSQVIEQFPANEGALLAAELVQPDRTCQVATLGALFFAYVEGRENVEHLIVWFKKFPVDVERRHDMVAKLDELITSSDATVRESALAFAEVVRPYRASEMETLSQLLKSPTALFAAIKDWYNKTPFDIDSAPVDPKEPLGQSFGDVVDAFEDNALSDIFKAKRSKAPQVAVKKTIMDPDPVIKPVMRTFKGLLETYKTDKSQFTALKDCFDKTPFDIDTVYVDPFVPNSETFGDVIDALNDDALSDIFKEKRSKMAHKLVKKPLSDPDPLVDPQVKTFIGLLKNYEADKSQLSALKDWFDKTPFDIDSTPEDPKVPHGQTCGDIIDALKDDSLSKIFKEKRSKPKVTTKQPVKDHNLDDQSKKRSFIVSRNAVIGCLMVGISCYIWYKKRSQNNSLEDKEVRIVD